MKDPLLVRTVIGLGPLLLFGVLTAWRKPQRSDGASLILSIVWVAAFIFPVQLMALRLGWWELRAEGGMFLGVPVDLWVGRAIATGALPLLLVPRASHALATALSAALGVALVLCDGAIVMLGPRWPVGALVELCVCVVPAQLIGTWTRDRTRVYGRVVLQLIEFSVLYVIIVTAMLVQTGGSWAHVWTYPVLVNVIVVLLLAVPLLTIGWGGILEFPARGLGTPLPYDTAPRLITSGGYAYIRNPVQLAVALLLVGVGLWVASPIVIMLGLLSVPISQVLSKWDEIYEMPRRYGDEFRAYQQNVRRWIPSWYPWSPRTARLHLGSGVLSNWARSIARPGVRGLDVVEAGSFRGLRYDPCDGLPEENDVTALARVMEHRNFALALLGIFVRLPPATLLVRLAVGVLGGRSAVVRQPMKQVDPTSDHPILVFDGHCRFCSGYVDFLIKRDPKDRLRFVHAQTAAGRALLERHRQPVENLEGSILVIGDQAFTRSTGWLKTMRLIGGAWSLTAIVALVPRRIRDAAFLAFGRKRYVLFGRTETCQRPDPSHAHRFLDSELLRWADDGGDVAAAPSPEGAR